VVYADNRNFYSHSWRSNYFVATQLRKEKETAFTVASAFRRFGVLLEECLGYDAAIFRVVEAQKLDRRWCVRIPEAVGKLAQHALGCEWYLQRYLTDSWYRQHGSILRHRNDDVQKRAYLFWKLRQQGSPLYSFISAEQVGCGWVLNEGSYSSR
jgi:hypothetical protein